jgi:hypothetical protein
MQHEPVSELVPIAPNAQRRVERGLPASELVAGRRSVGSERRERETVDLQAELSRSLLEAAVEREGGRVGDDPRCVNALRVRVRQAGLAHRDHEIADPRLDGRRHRLVAEADATALDIERVHEELEGWSARLVSRCACRRRLLARAEELVERHRGQRVDDVRLDEPNALEGYACGARLLARRRDRKEGLAHHELELLPADRQLLVGGVRQEQLAKLRSAHESQARSRIAIARRAQHKPEIAVRLARAQPRLELRPRDHAERRQQQVAPDEVPIVDEGVQAELSLERELPAFDAKGEIDREHHTAARVHLLGAEPDRDLDRSRVRPQREGGVDDADALDLDRERGRTLGGFRRRRRLARFCAAPDAAQGEVAIDAERGALDLDPAEAEIGSGEGDLGEREPREPELDRRALRREVCELQLELAQVETVDREAPGLRRLAGFWLRLRRGRAERLDAPLGIALEAELRGLERELAQVDASVEERAPIEVDEEAREAQQRIAGIRRGGRRLGRGGHAPDHEPFERDRALEQPQVDVRETHWEAELAARLGLDRARERPRQQRTQPDPERREQRERHQRTTAPARGSRRLGVGRGRLPGSELLGDRAASSSPAGLRYTNANASAPRREPR